MRIAKEALTFDDVLLQPGYSEILPREVDLSTSLTREIRLSIPLLSAAMDTVTEARLAIALAQEGGDSAMQLRVAEQYIEQFGELAKEGNTLVVPADLSNIASMVAMASRINSETSHKGNGAAPHHA